MASASLMNHFLYAQIHGYEYKFVHARKIEGLHDTWVRTHVLYDLLHEYKFVLALDADAIITHLELPLEWLFNRWNITERTSIAMPIDTRQTLNGDVNASCDSKGKVDLNCGVVVVQNLPYTFDMLTAWKTCTQGRRYPGCQHLKSDWPHEQRAFSEHIRYDFNKDGDNIVVSTPLSPRRTLDSSDGKIYRKYHVTTQWATRELSSILIFKVTVQGSSYDITLWTRT